MTDEVMVMIMNDFSEKARFFYSKGKEKLEEGQLNESIKDLLYAQQLFSTTGNDQYNAKALILLAEAYMEVNNKKQAKDAYVQAYTLFKKLGDKKNIAECSFNLGKLYRELGDFIKSKFYFAEAIEIYSALKDAYMIGVAWREFAIAYQTFLPNVSEHPLHAINAYKRSISWFKKAKAQEEAMEVSYDLAQLLINNEKYKEAIEYLTRISEYYIKNRKHEHAVTILLQIGTTYMKLNEKKKAKEYLTKAKEYMKKSKTFKDEKIKELERTIKSLFK